MSIETSTLTLSYLNTSNSLSQLNFNISDVSNNIKKISNNINNLFTNLDISLDKIDDYESILKDLFNNIINN